MERFLVAPDNIFTEDGRILYRKNERVRISDGEEDIEKQLRDKGLVGELEVPHETSVVDVVDQLTGAAPGASGFDFSDPSGDSSTPAYIAKHIAQSVPAMAVSAATGAERAIVGGALDATSLAARALGADAAAESIQEARRFNDMLFDPKAAHDFLLTGIADAPDKRAIADKFLAGGEAAGSIYGLGKAAQAVGAAVGTLAKASQEGSSLLQGVKGVEAVAKAAEEGGVIGGRVAKAAKGGELLTRTGLALQMGASGYERGREQAVREQADGTYADQSDIEKAVRREVAAGASGLKEVWKSTLFGKLTQVWQAPEMNAMLNAVEFGGMSASDVLWNTFVSDKILRTGANWDDALKESAVEFGIGGAQSLLLTTAGAVKAGAEAASRLLAERARERQIIAPRYVAIYRALQDRAGEVRQQVAEGANGERVLEGGVLVRPVEGGAEGELEMVTPDGVVLDAEGNVKTVAAGGVGQTGDNSYGIAITTRTNPLTGRPTAARETVRNALIALQEGVTIDQLREIDGWTPENKAVFEVVARLKQGLAEGMPAGELVDALAGLGIGEAEARAFGFIPEGNRYVGDALAVANNGTRQLQNAVGNGGPGQIPLDIAAEVARSVNAGTTGLMPKELGKRQLEVARQLMAERAKAELEKGAAEHDNTPEAERAVLDTPVEKEDGSLTTLGVLEESGGKDTTGAPRPETPAEEIVSASMRPAPSGEPGVYVHGAVPEAKVRAGVEIEMPDGAKERGVLVEGLDPAEMLRPERREAVTDFLVELMDQTRGNVAFDSPEVEAAARELLQGRVAREEAARTVELVDAGQRLVNNLFGEESGIKVRKGTDAERMEAAEGAVGKNASVELLKDTAGEIKGYWDRAKREVVLFDGATPETLGHEIAWHAVRHWAETHSPELLAKMNEYARKCPEDLRKLIEDAYKDFTGDALLDEIGAGRFEDKLGARFAELLERNQEARTWWEKVKEIVAAIWKAGVRAFKGNDIDLGKLAGMDSRQAMEWLVGQMLEGKRLGGWVEESPPARDAGESAMSGGDTVAEGENGKRYTIKSATYDLAESSMMRDLTEPRKVGKLTLPPVFTKREAASFARSMRRLIERMRENPEALDLNEMVGREDRPFLPYKDNSDPIYKMSLDFSTLCKKRLFCQHVIESLQVKLDRPLSAKEQMGIREKLLEYQKVEQGLQVACAICYVEAARLKSPKQMGKWLDDPTAALKNFFAKTSKEFAPVLAAKVAAYKRSLGLPETATKADIKRARGAGAVTKLNNLNKEWRQDYRLTPEEQAIVARAKKLPRSTFLTAENLTKLLGKEPEIYSAYIDFIRNSTRSKALEEDTPYYYGDSRALSDGFIKKMNEQGTGLRHQSWSDFQVQHLLDTMVAICDLSVRNAKMHAYTKVPEFARLFGRTGMMMNLSLIPNKDGKGFSGTEGMDYRTALRLREMYPDTCGTIAIGISDGQISQLLNDPGVDYVIPYHVSGLNKELRRMVGIVSWKDYTQHQHEKEVKGASKPAGMPADDWQRPPDLSEWLVREPGVDGAELMRRGSERYLALCHERGLVPKFAGVEGLLERTADGWKLKNENYWKLLIDHKMVNHKTGQLIEQRAVRPDFDFGDISKVVDAEVKKYDPGLADRALKYIMGSDLGEKLSRGSRSDKRLSLVNVGGVKVPTVTDLKEAEKIRAKNPESVKGYIMQHLEDSIALTAGGTASITADTAHHYGWSPYNFVTSTNGTLRKARARMATILSEILGQVKADGSTRENKPDKNGVGWRCRMPIGVPVLDNRKNVVDMVVYDADVIVKDQGHGKYLYDITRLEKNAVLTPGLANQRNALFGGGTQSAASGATALGKTPTPQSISQSGGGAQGQIRPSIRISPEEDAAYLDAVKRGDMDKAQEMVCSAAGVKGLEEFNRLNSDANEQGFKYHRGPAPKRTRTMYAVFNVSPDGFRAAYAGNANATPVGVWLDAVNLRAFRSRTMFDDKGNPLFYIPGDTGAEAKSKGLDLDEIAAAGVKGKKWLLQRGGKHGSSVPNFAQMNTRTNEAGEKVRSSAEGALPHNKLIFEIEVGIGEGGDLTDYVRENGRMIAGKNQGLAEIGPNQFYSFKTNPNANGEWGIAGTFRIKRLVPHDEVVSKTEEANARIREHNAHLAKGEKPIREIPLQKWVGGYHPEDSGISVESVDRLYQEGLKKKLMDPVTYDDNGEVIPLSERFNLEKKDARYSRGVPYQGSKSRIADRIVAALPAGGRFVDLFSGGGAVTHAAMESGKYANFRMNDLDGRGQRLFLEGANGKWRNYGRTKMFEKEFARIKGTPEAIPWSFNGLGRSLAKAEEGGRDRAAEQIRRVQSLESLRDQASRTESSEADYRQVELRPGDVVYADIPYENTDQRGYGAGAGFDKAAFCEWAQQQGVPIFVSEYSMPEGWTELESFSVPGMRGGERTEKLFVQSQFAGESGGGDLRLSRGYRPGDWRKTFTFGKAARGDAEQTPGGIAAGEERRRWEENPVDERIPEWDAPARNPNIAKPFALSSAEGVRLVKLLGGVMKKPKAYKDAIGVIDESDEQQIRDDLKAMGFFKGDDFLWAATATPAEVESDRADSQAALDARLERLGEQRLKGEAGGGNRDLVRVSMSQVADLVLSLPAETGGNLGNVRTLAQGIVRGFERNRTPEQAAYYLQEAQNLIGWFYGHEGDTGPRPGGSPEGAPPQGARDVRKMIARAFGAFLEAPDAVAERAPGLYREFVDAISRNDKLLHAFDAIRQTALGEGSAARVYAEIEAGRTAQAEEAARRLADEVEKPIGSRLERAKDSFVYNFDDMHGPIFMHITRAQKRQLAELKASLKAGRITQADYDAATAAFRQAVQGLKIAELKVDRGSQNEIRQYLWDMSFVFEQAKAAGVDPKDAQRYMDLRWIVSTGGRAGARGMSARDAQICLDNMKEHLGDEAFARLEGVSAQFHAVREKNILDDPRLAAMIGQDRVNYFKNNVHYVRTERTRATPEELAQMEADRAAFRRQNKGDDDVTAAINKFIRKTGGEGKGFGGKRTWGYMLEGSEKDIEDRLAATWRNDTRLMAAMERNDFVLKMRDALLAAKAVGVHDLPGDRAVDYPQNARYGHIRYFENGRMRVLVLPRVLADGYRQVSDAMTGWNAWGKIAHGVFIDWNLAYTLRNMTRNMASNESNIVGMRADNATILGNALLPGAGRAASMTAYQIARHLPSAVFRNPFTRAVFGGHVNAAYARQAQRILELYLDPKKAVARQAAAEEARLRGDTAPAMELASDLEMMRFVTKGGALIARFDEVRGAGRDADLFMRKSGLGEIYGEKGTSAPTSRAHKILAATGKVLSYPFRRNAQFNRDLELHAKITAALAIHEMQPGLTAEQVGIEVARRASIPHAERRGANSKMINYAWNMFFNTALKGGQRFVGNVVRNPRLAGKMAAQSLGPQLFWATMIAGGGLAAVIRNMFGGGDDAEEKARQAGLGGLLDYAQFMHDGTFSASPYLQRFYHWCPLGQVGGRYIGIASPRTDEEKMLLPFIDWAAARLAPQPSDPTVTMSDAVKRSVVGTFLPDMTARTPLVAAAQDLVFAWILNPFDTYRGTHVYNQNLWHARFESFADAADFFAATMSQTWNDLGGRTIVRPRRNEIEVAEGSGAAVPSMAERAWDTILNDIPVLSGVLGGSLRMTLTKEQRLDQIEREVLAQIRAVKNLRSEDLMKMMLESPVANNGNETPEIKEKLDAWAKRYGWDEDERGNVFARAFNGYQAATAVGQEMAKERKEMRREKRYMKRPASERKAMEKAGIQEIQSE